MNHILAAVAADKPELLEVEPADEPDYSDDEPIPDPAYADRAAANWAAGRLSGRAL